VNQSIVEDEDQLDIALFTSDSDFGLSDDERDGNAGREADFKHPDSPAVIEPEPRAPDTAVRVADFKAPSPDNMDAELVCSRMTLCSAMTVADRRLSEHKGTA
jgi:hypothetical protein